MFISADFPSIPLSPRGARPVWSGITDVSTQHHALSERYTAQDVDTGLRPAISSNSCLQAGQRIMLHPVRRISAGGILYPQCGHGVVRSKLLGSILRLRRTVAMVQAVRRN